MNKNPDIELNDREIELLNRISFDSDNQQEIRASIMPMVALSELLLQRNAIPSVRLSYFSDPERNPGGKGKSRKQIFESNGTYGKQIFAHPNFMKHLRYYVFGPNLPDDIIQLFKETAELSSYLTDGDIDDLLPNARSIVRKYRLNPYEASEEFFKLALECGASPSSADKARKSVRYAKIQ
jgi:hypothetical protein